MDNILFPTITTIKSANNNYLKNEPRKKFRFKGKVIHMRQARNDENGKTVILISTDLSIKELDSLKNKEITILSE
ncbi:MAG: hypothetical protein PWQ25_799 [Deferribacteres bacterium]|jgi:hypothetical protein|nr:hypothetical protein [Deferribacteres bacterium]